MYLSDLDPEVRDRLAAKYENEEDDMSHTAVVAELPKCDLCNATAAYDGRTVGGSWAYMCEGCFGYLGVGTGLGKGQKLIVVKP